MLWFHTPPCIRPASSFLLTKEQLETGGTCMSRSQSRSIETEEALCLGFSSWNHQLGLVRRSRWDIEIPGCP